MNRKHLANMRVVQKNLVYVIGLSPKIANEEVGNGQNNKYSLFFVLWKLYNLILIFKILRPNHVLSKDTAVT